MCVCPTEIFYFPPDLRLVLRISCLRGEGGEGKEREEGMTEAGEGKGEFLPEEIE